MTQEQYKALDLKVASHREELLSSQQGELDAVLMYQRLAKVVKTDGEDRLDGIVVFLWCDNGEQTGAGGNTCV